MKKKYIFIILLIILIIVLSYVFIFHKKIKFDYKLFKENRSEWLNKNLDNYSFGYGFSCGEGWGDFSVVVKDKKAISVVDNTNDDGSAPGSTGTNYSMDNIFERIEKEYLLNKNKIVINNCAVDSIRVEYDKNYSFPLNYGIYNRCPKHYIDGEGCSYWIKNFKIID